MRHSARPPGHSLVWGGGTHWSPFLLMRFVRGEKCCISVFCVASRVPQNHPVVGKILSEASVPSCSQLLPSVTAPRRLSFSSSRPEKNLSIAAVDVSADSGSQQQQQQQQPAHAAQDGLTSPLCDPPPPPLPLCSALKETLEVCRNVQPQFARQANQRAANPPHGRMLRSQQESILQTAETFITRMITAPCRNVRRLYFIS